jgi:hypothetical protein
VAGIYLKVVQRQRHCQLRGYSADDNPEARDEWFARFADWFRAGTIRFPQAVIDGLERDTLLCAIRRKGVTLAPSS